MSAPPMSTGPSTMERRTLLSRSGGAYIPPAKLAALQEAEAAAALAHATPRERDAHTQRLTWDALKRSINGLINKLNTSNIKWVVPELFRENIHRGRGLFCRALMKAQAASLPYTPVYAALVAVLNTKFPQIGELLLMRLIAQWRRGYKRMDKGVCLSVVTFLAHLVNQKVANDVLALQIITLLLSKPTDDSVEIAVGFIRQIGAHLASESPKALVAVFERLRSILHEGMGIDKRTMYMVEVLFQLRKEQFKDHPPIPEGLDLVEEADQLTHSIFMTDTLDTQDLLNVFAYDPEYEEHERAYQAMKREILGDESEEEDGSDGVGSGDEEEEEEESGAEDSGEPDAEHENALEQAHQKMIIQDQTNTNLINLRRAIYLTIMSSLNFEECAHKLLKLDIRPGQEQELINMVVECCSQEKTFVTFYGFLAERFAKLNPVWTAAFERAFEELYKTIHRFETNRLRNIANLFAYLLATDSISWRVWALVSITEADTTSSSRIFLKILLQKLVETMGLAKLKERMCGDPAAALAAANGPGGGRRRGGRNDMIITISTPQGLVNQGVFEGCFPRDDPRNTRFAINYFTSTGLGALTEDLREHLKAVSARHSAEQASEYSSSDEEESGSAYSSASGTESDYSRASRRSAASSRAGRGRHPPSRSPAPTRGRSPPPLHHGSAPVAPSRGVVHSERAHLLPRESPPPAPRAAR